jgi:hypothetical protein
VSRSDVDLRHVMTGKDLSDFAKSLDLLTWLTQSLPPEAIKAVKIRVGVRSMSVVLL